MGRYLRFRASASRKIFEGFAEILIALGVYFWMDAHSLNFLFHETEYYVILFVAAALALNGVIELVRGLLAESEKSANEL
jgi:hypothetical protein